MDSNEARHSTAHYFLEGLNEIGFDYLFCNFGTDHAPLIEAMASFRRGGRKMPATILCPHENTAVHMAAGYAIATGRGQGVMVHVDAGTANSAMALHNLCRARVPVMLMAGKAPYTTRNELLGTRDTYVHFVQEPFDQASIVRPYTKWEYNLPSGVIAKEALRRAHTVMESDPKGPVYMTFPRETLTATWSEGEIRSYPAERFGAVAARGVDPAALEPLVTRLLAAERPLLISAYAGRNHATVAVLDELARFAGIRVVEFNPLYVNLPHDSPCHGGFSPARALADADVGLLVDVDVPWIPSDMPDNPATWWAHIDVDAEKRNFPIWTFPGNLRLPGDSHRILSDLLAALKARADDGLQDPRRRPRRQDGGGGRGAARTGGEARRQPRQAGRDQSALPLLRPGQGARAGRHRAERGDPQRTRGVAADAADQARHPDRPVGRRARFLRRHGARPEARLPERTIVQIVGDGTFYFSNPQSTLAVGRQYKLPVLTVVLDNTGWAAVKEATLRVYPDGDARGEGEFGATLAPDMDFSKVAEAAGAHGELVSDPDAVEAAVARCVAAVKGGRSAVLHARVTKL